MARNLRFNHCVFWHSKKSLLNLGAFAMPLSRFFHSIFFKAPWVGACLSYFAAVTFTKTPFRGISKLQIYWREAFYYKGFFSRFLSDFYFLASRLRNVGNSLFRALGLFISIHSTTSTTDTSTTDSTRITNKMATSSDYLMKWFNGFLAVLLE